MSGFDNEVLYSIGERLEASTSQAIQIMQKTATDVSNINHTGNPEGVVSANPSSLSHDPVSGNIYVKTTGTGNTGWIALLPPLMRSATIVLTSPQIKNLHATPIQIVPSPGLGNVLVGISAMSKLHYGGSNVFVAAAGQELDIAYAGTEVSPLQAVPGNNGLVASSSNYTAAVITPTQINQIGVASMENLGFTVGNFTATEISGNAANDNTISITIVYYIVSL